MKTWARVFIATSLASLLPFAVVPGLHGRGLGLDAYFLALTVQCTGTVLFLNALASVQSGRRRSMGHAATSISILTVGFIAMGFLDGILGTMAACSGGCPVVLAAFAVVLMAIYGLEMLALSYAEGFSVTNRRRVVFGFLTLWTLVLGSWGYWAMGWSVFFPTSADAVVLLYKLGPISLSASGAALAMGIATTPLAHLAGGFTAFYLMRRPHRASQSSPR